MALEYMINYPCKVKKNLGVEGLLRLIRARGLYYFAIQHPEYQKAAGALTFETITPRGISQQTIDLSAVEAQVAELERWVSTCRRCKASIFDAAGGCWWFIRYPVARQVEELLIQAAVYAVEQEKTGLGKEFLRSVMEIDVREVPRLRRYRDKEGEPLFFELPAGLVHRWKEGLRLWAVNTDQILEALFASQYFKGKQLAAHAVFYCLFDDLASAFVDSLPPGEREVVALNIRYFQDLAGALRRAYELEVSITMDC